MGHRGRHRRRGRGRALRAGLAGTGLALTAAATLISASQATVTDDPGRLESLGRAERASLRLVEDRVPEHRLDRLSATLGAPEDVAAVLGSADGTLAAGDDCASTVHPDLPIAPRAVRSFCWDERETRGWLPGGVAASGDTDGPSGPDGVVVAGWSRDTGAYAGGGLARVDLVAADDTVRGGGTSDREGPRRASALLVVPVEGGDDYRGLASPVEGIVRHRDKLLVTAGPGDRNALYVFDLDRFHRANVESAAVGRVPGGWAALGHRHVLPAVAAYRMPGGPGVPRPSVLSLDRGTSPPGLVAGEWVEPDTDGPTRLWRYAFSAEPGRAGLPAADSTGRVEAREAYRTGANGVAGVLTHRPAGRERAGWYLGRVAGDGDTGRASLVRQDSEGTRAVVCGADRSQRCWSLDAGALSYRAGTDEVWSRSGRVLFAVPLAAIDDVLD
ncbi:hypothetical protein AAH978_18275 [Streptomyces sp. ZYX-F-203]